LIDTALRKTIIEFTAIDDFAVYLDLAAITPGTYRLAVNIAHYPTLHFSVRVEGAADRTIGFVSPAPACATISVQQASAGASVSRRIHMVNFALPAKHEAVVLVAGADLKGDTKYMQYANTWRDDLYHGCTDLDDQPNLSIKRGVHDHTVVSIFDFRTGYLEKQVKGTRGWHSMYRAMQGTEPPAIERPKAEGALERRQAADSISITDVYYYISELGRASPGCLRQLHFFSHAFRQGPILLNTDDSNDGISDLRDPTDKDPRTKDFLPINLARYSHLPAAFVTDAYVKNWGCFSSDMRGRLDAVARTKSLDEVAMYKGKPYTSADVVRELRMHTFPDSYMVAFCRELGVDGWSSAPGTKSSYKSSENRRYFHVDEHEHGAIIGWYERNFGCQRDVGGAISFRKLV
jgi:hypothetical protein